MDTENWNSTLISIKQIRDTFLKGNKLIIEKGVGLLMIKAQFFIL